MRRDPLPEISANTKRTWQRSREDHSAGGIAYRRLGDTVEVALIATHGGQRWQLPKGSREAGETIIETAIREVEEEVGLRTTNEAFLKRIDYWYWDTYRKEVPELVHKIVDFYLLRMVSGDLCDDSYEVDAVGWFTLEQALEMLTFEGEKSVVQLASEILAGSKE
ncbi:MAG: NUDIX hydrolase [Chloroflexi bacterium]|nr:NUDIX hydrolase [Chloroflexota bacterium]